MASTLRELMTTRVVYLRTNDTVATAVELMTRYGFSALPVLTAGGRIVGIVSLLDVLRFREVHVEEGLVADDATPITELMNPEVITMAPTANPASVARRLVEAGQLRVLPVEVGGRLVGIVTRSDLLRGEREDKEDDEEADALAYLLRPPRRPGLPAPAGARVTEVMTTSVVAVAPTDPIALATGLLLRDRHTSLPVVEPDGRLVGVISEADILADPFRGRQVHTTVGRLMTQGALSIDHTATVGEARAVVADHGLRNLPVVQGDRLVGVLSRSDLV
jgi:CBS domain-containing protein